MTHVPHASLIRQRFGIAPDAKDDDLVAVPIGALRCLLSLLVGRTAGTFDEARYLETYGDVAGAVENGVYESGFEHYLRYGYWEGREAAWTDFDADYYRARYRDLASANQPRPSK